MKLFTTCGYIFLTLLGTFFIGATTAQQKIGIFDNHSDIGDSVKTGAATFIPQTGQYVISGAGYNIWADHDEFQYVYKKMKGDFILHTRAKFVGDSGVEEHRKIGWMVRKSLEGKSSQVNAVIHGDGLTSLQYRKTFGAETGETKSKITHANIIELERKGNDYIMRVAKEGNTFVTEKISSLDLGDEVYVGLFVGSHNADVLETGVFDNVRITVPAWNGLVPYKDYLSSDIEIVELATGTKSIILHSADPLQSPNWMKDSKSLLFNSKGIVYQFDLNSKKIQPLNTGSVKRNNNDHVLSFDGKNIGLSSEVEKAGGSLIYTVSSSGGEPKLITPKGPSYLHGWSPDGKTIAYCAQRNDNYDVYTKSSDGTGNEIRLTNNKGLDDGPEYTPDGKYIYFNSNRTGTMSIWRMKPDGSQQEQVTDGEYHDWFPHISPDGKWIQFISFSKDEVPSDDHPFYKHVYIRVMPFGGGKPKVIAYVYGGQGTINTPSWSPDSKRIAFISYTSEK